MSPPEDENKAPEDLNEKLAEFRNIVTYHIAINNTLENKASSFMGFSALVISVILFALNSMLTPPLKGPIANFWVQIAFYILIIVVIYIIIRGLYDLWSAIKIRAYLHTLSDDPNEILQIFNKDSEEFRESIIEDYRVVISHHNCINKKKKDLLFNGIKRISVGFIASVFIMVILIAVKIIGGAYG